MSVSCLHDLVEQWVLKDPERLAVSGVAGQFTYGELAARSEQGACYLQNLGVRRGDVVGVAARRSPQLIVTLLSILKAGAAYFPLDYEDPPARLAVTLSEVGCRLVLVDEELAGWSRHAAAIPTAPIRPPAGQARDGFRSVPACPDDLAYVMCTSGSTGRPKGVQVTHGAIVNLVRGDYALFDAGQTFCALAPLAFDASTFEIWGALCNGARLIVPPPGSVTPADIGEIVQVSQVTVLWLTKGLFNLMIDTAPGALAGLRQLITGGDTLSPAHVKAALERLPHVRLSNGYGPTEATTFTAVHREISRDDVGGPVPIGRPVPGAVVRVLDDRLRPVPAGRTGELYVAGAGLARGYTSPARTAERFVPDPCSAVPGTRMYRTGDLVRQRRDGTLEFLGRQDQQVKVRGHRVELEEVELAAGTHAAVRHACCIPVPDASGERSLACYVVLAPGADAVDVRRHLARRLPEYARPAWVIPLASLPLTRNGKIDREKLPAPHHAGSGGPGNGLADAGDAGALAENICRLYEQFLGGTPVSPDDDFFALGGNSLLAIHLAVRLGQDLAREVPQDAITTARTPAAVARLLDGAHSAGGGVRSPAVIPRRDRGSAAPLSGVQEQIWILQKLYPDSRAYHFQALIELGGQLSVPALETALAQIQVSHEVFRTSFREREDGTAVQVIHEPAEYRLPVTDLSHRADREAALDDEIKAAVAAPLPPDRWPLARWVLIRMADDQHVLVHVEHHLIHDGWSFNLFLKELCSRYQNALWGASSVSANERGADFADFAAWHRNMLDSGVRGRQLRYWLRKLDGFTAPPELPVDRSRSSVWSSNGESLRMEMADSACARARSFSRSRAIPLYHVLLAAFVALLHHDTGGTDLCVGSAFANRRWPGVDTLIGMLVTSLPLRIDIDPERSFASLLSLVGRTVQEAQENADTPIQDIVSALNIRRDPARNPLFDAEFSFHDSPLGSLQMPGLAVRVTEGISNGFAKFDLSVVAIPRLEQSLGTAGPQGSGITLIWEYRADLFDRATVERIADRYLQVLDSAVSRPDARLADIVAALPPLPGRAGRVSASDQGWPGPGHPLEATDGEAATQAADDLAAQIASVFAGVLGVPSLSPDADFFDAGGTSLLAIRAATRIGRTLRVKVKPADVLRYPQVRALARHIEGLGEECLASDAPLRLKEQNW